MIEHMPSPDDAQVRKVRLAGVFLLAAGQSFVHLSILGGQQIAELLPGVEPMGTYPYALFHALLSAAGRRFRDLGPVLEQLGIEMMRSWYNLGPGQGLVKSGAEFLRFQTGSEGYRSVVSGPEAVVGRFALEALDEAAGTARVRSSTPFPRAMERGVLLGGMQAPGDLVFVEVTSPAEPNVFEIRFH